MLIKIAKFIFLANFIILDMDKDKDISIILERPFLAIGWALIDVQWRDLRLQVQDEEVTFNIYNALKYSIMSESCFRIDSLNYAITNKLEEPKKHWKPIYSVTILPCLMTLKPMNMQYERIPTEKRKKKKKKYFKELGQDPPRPLSFIIRPPILELKQLP